MLTPSKAPKKVKKLNQQGNATVEMIPILFLFILLFNFTLGFFGIIHSGILNSIAARNYAFETFRNRSNLSYLRDEPGGDANCSSSGCYAETRFRFHGIVSEDAKPNYWVPTARNLKFIDRGNLVSQELGRKDHNNTVRKKSQIDEKTSEAFGGDSLSGDIGVSPVWIMTQYGICLDSLCEGI